MKRRHTAGDEIRLLNDLLAECPFYNFAGMPHRRLDIAEWLVKAGVRVPRKVSVPAAETPWQPPTRALVNDFLNWDALSEVANG